MTNAEKWHTVRRMVAIMAPLGALVGLILNVVGGGGGRSMISGGLIGLLISIGMVAFEVAWAVELIPRRWREAPFLVVLATRSLVWLGVIVVGIGLPLLVVNRTPVEDLTTATTALSIGASFAVALVANFIGQINRLLGRGVMVGLILGRYHRPREEVRIFLLFDLRGSTPIAERLGNLRYHAFVKRFVGDVATTAALHGGEVHRYVGDEVIVTWTEEDGAKDAACVRCVFAIADTFEQARPEYMEDFGVAPAFWASLHLGPVVTGEVGTVKHEIVHLGDTLNTAARIQEACRQFARPFLASADLIDALELPSDVVTDSLGPVDLRGVGSPIELLAVNRHAGEVSTKPVS